MSAVDANKRAGRNLRDILTASEVAGVLAAVSAGTYFFRYLEMRVRLTAARKAASAYNLEAISEAAEAEAFIVALIACVIALPNTFVDYKWLSVKLHRVGERILALSKKTLMGAYMVFVWVLFGTLSLKTMYPLMAALYALMTMLWLSGKINRAALFSTTFLLVVALFALARVNASL